ncbi:MAG: ABC transporter ATP-binding protein [Lachnospiraceae bacterium]|nr:ABC transporter ATP-binding protein [Lachnospiraceae bacterium]
MVGESGSGKSLTAMSIMGILSEKAVITGGSILLDKECFSSVKYDSDDLKFNEEGYADLTVIPENIYRRLRGGKLAYVFQEPMTSLNPVQKIGVQIDEILDIHAADMPEDEQKRLVLEAMKDTGLHEVEKLYDMYPHELSGGMRQRVIIAMALVARAEIIIADEPTTALDANVADVILDIFKKINKKYGCSIIIISHDLRVIGRLANRALIMQKGRIAEIIDVDEGKSSFAKPQTEYGKRLLNAAFTTKSFLEESGEGSKESIVELDKLSVFYKNRKNSDEKLRKVIDNVSLKLIKGQTTGFVGESGCGKTTLVKAIAGLQKYTEGTIKLNCKHPAMVFQDPYSSLNPAFTVERILREPLILQNRGSSEKLSKEQMHEIIVGMLKETELEEEIASRSINELSGGQRQRIAIALTLILKRELIILDEPVSALDVTIQEQILELLMKLKKEFGLTYILISHDERLVARICDRVYNVKNGHCT